MIQDSRQNPYPHVVTYSILSKNESTLNGRSTRCTFMYSSVYLLTIIDFFISFMTLVIFLLPTLSLTILTLLPFWGGSSKLETQLETQGPSLVGTNPCIGQSIQKSVNNSASDFLELHKRFVLSGHTYPNHSPQVPFLLPYPSL